MVEAYLPIREGATVPEDWRYLVYSMLKHECRPDITARGWQLLPIHGRKRGDLIHFHRDDGLHCLRLRVPVGDLGYLAKLEGRPVRVSQHLLILGEPCVREIARAPVLHSEIVVITSDEEDRGVRGEEYGLHVGKRLGAMLGHLDFGVDIGKRTLTPEESARLQLEGIGESRGIGCGVFEPLHSHLDGGESREREAWGMS